MVSQGEQQEAFCASAWPKLVGAVTHHCGGDVHLAQEFVQEALLRACRRWSYVSTLDSPEGWTFRVAVNLANSAFRRRRARRRAYERYGSQPVQHDTADGAEQLTVRGALSELTDRQREAVLLRYFLDLSAEQTAKLTGSTAGAVRALTHRAVIQLRDVLDVAVPATNEEASDVS